MSRRQGFVKQIVEYPRKDDVGLYFNCPVNGV